MFDPFAWLEDIEGDASLSWVRRLNARTEADLFVGFDRLRAEILGILEAEDRIPLPSRQLDSVFNFWTDSSHRRGVFRRTTWEEYRLRQERWEVLLDVDALGQAEGESWVMHGLTIRRPDRRRCLVDLSPGGSDASVTREFDLVERRFVTPEEGGFFRPLSKGWLEWIDADSVYAGHDFGPGTTTTSGYPRTVRRWARGTVLAEAPVVFEGELSDVAVAVHVETLPGHRHHLFERQIDFFRARRWILRGSELLGIDAPDDADVGVHAGWLLLRLRSDWEADGARYSAGALLAAELEDFLAGGRSMRAAFIPDSATALAGYTWTRNRLILNVQHDVRDRIEAIEVADVADVAEAEDTSELSAADGDWRRSPLGLSRPTWSVAALPVDPDLSDELFLLGEDFLTPSSLYWVDGQEELLRAAPERFDTSGLEISQHFATSPDGTRIPYFLVGPSGPPQPRPTVLTGYGGFEISMGAHYSAVVGHSWLSVGGQYAVANIRGGGEYGPAWHEAALRDRRHRAYEDFESVAQDMIARSVTSPAQLGIMGGSNGGLLVGNMYVRHPELLGAVVCQAPLLDMKRYSHLLAGASWIAEYGDPDDPADWEFMRQFSPYHLIDPERTYPPLLLTTSTRDDRVHPGHARKMAAALLSQGQDVTYWENIEGGHAGAADSLQQATMQALAFTFLRRHLIEEIP